MSCESCKHDNLTDEAKAVRAAQEMAQRYKFLCRAVAALVVGFAIMTGCMVWAIVNAQQIANDAVMAALNTVAEMEVIHEETTQTVEGDSATINNGSWEQYNDNAVNEGGGD